MRVLLVEDEIFLAQQLQRALADGGYAVDCAADGARAEFPARPNATMRSSSILDCRGWTG
jgi:DNA-binding response OmpR family regulator